MISVEFLTMFLFILVFGYVLPAGWFYYRFLRVGSQGIYRLPACAAKEVQ